MKVWAVLYHDQEKAQVCLGGIYTDESKARLEEDYDTWVEERTVVDWDAAHSEKDVAVFESRTEKELFRPASLQLVVSQPSLTAAMTRAWLAWLAYNQPETVVSGDEMVDGKIVRKGETAAAAWSRLQSSESEREFLKLQSLVPSEPQR